MISKEEIFIIYFSENFEKNDNLPYFSTENKTHNKKNIIITENPLKDCISWLEKNNINEPTIYLGLWFDEEDTIQKNWEISPVMMSRIVKLNGTLCISIY